MPLARAKRSVPMIRWCVLLLFLKRFPHWFKHLLHQQELMFDRFEKEYAKYDKLPLHRAERLVQGIRGPIVGLVHKFWQDKRKRVNRPLLAQFQLPPDPNDPDPAKTFRPREKEISIRRRLRKQQNDKDAFQKLNKIKAEFEQVHFSSCATPRQMC